MKRTDYKRGWYKGELMTCMLTAIAHNHDFGIDTVLVPGTPVRIHARISGHGSDLRGKEGTRKRSAGGRGRGGGIKGRRRRRRKRRRGKGAGERKRGRLARRNQSQGRGEDAIHHVGCQICGSAFLWRSAFCGKVQLIAYPAQRPSDFTITRLPRSEGKNFMDKKV